MISTNYKSIFNLLGYGSADFKLIRANIINFLLREFNISSKRPRHHRYYRTRCSGKKSDVVFVSDSKIEFISNTLLLPFNIVKLIIFNFLREIVNFNRFFCKVPIKKRVKNPTLQVRSYLHKIYRLIPVFDYKKALFNLKVLNLKLNDCYRPQIFTQLAFLIFITDMNNPVFKSNRLIQCNIRTICSVSAYAFHNLRNAMGIKIK